MNHQRGFILPQLSLMMWGAIAAGVVIAGLTLALYVQTIRLTASKAEYAEFKGGVEALGRAAEKAAKDKALKDKLTKENADAQNSRTTSNLRSELKRLRDERASGGGLRAPAPVAASPDRTCFEPAKLTGALQRLDEGVLGLLESCSKAVIDLDTTKAWAREAVR